MCTFSFFFIKCLSSLFYPVFYLYVLFSGKAVSQLWMNSGDPSKMMQPNMPEEEEVDDEEMGVAETYADYMPTKCKKSAKS